mmetsp:Transcript_21849/g.67265  ORF Transcript_21849/g.67265 Transcript_21849/m.67265 type:complete len:765 (-) Transcript_21849:1154-3448(-)
MGASASLGASEPAPDAADAMATPVVEPAPEAAADATPEAAADATTPEPEAKRPHAAADLLGSLAKEGNLSAILGFAGYRTVLTLETLSWRARRAARDARIELDATHETRQNRLMKIFYRAELLDLRRRKAFPDKMLYSLFYLFDGWKHRASDVQFDGRRVLLLCPPPRRLHGVVAVDASARDEVRSIASLAATKRVNSSMLSLGHCSLILSHRGGDERGWLRCKEFLAQLQVNYKPPMAKFADEETVASLVASMSGGDEAVGTLMIPRRLVLAARRRQDSRQRGTLAVRNELDVALRKAARASAVLDVAAAGRVLTHFWKCMSRSKWGAVTRETFIDKVAAAAGLGTSDALVVWDEAINGLLVPLLPLYFPAGSKPPLGTTENPDGDARASGDIRCGDVVALQAHEYFCPAIFGLAVTSLARDPSTCFSTTAHLSFGTFEKFVVRQSLSDQGSAAVSFISGGTRWSVALAVLDDLEARREGEADAEPGKARVREAIASLLVATRVRPLQAGATVEHAVGEPDLPRDEDVSWSRATIVSRDVHSAVIRMETNAEEKTVSLGSLRLVEDEPSAAAILLAHAAADHRYDIMQQILASDVMGNSPLSFTVGEPGKPISLRTDARATALDHAIVSRNIVGIGLLSDAYTRDQKLWQCCVATCHSLEKISSPQLTPKERADFSCAMRCGPGAYRHHMNPWTPFMVALGRQLEMILSPSMSTLPRFARDLMKPIESCGARNCCSDLCRSFPSSGAVSKIGKTRGRTQQTNC